MNVNCSILFCSYFQLKVIIFYLSVDELQDCNLVPYIIIVFFLLSGFQKAITYCFWSFNHKYCFSQVRLTDALVSSLEFSKSKDAELAWLDAMMVTRNKSVAKPITENMETNGIQSNGESQTGHCTTLCGDQKLPQSHIHWLEHSLNGQSTGFLCPVQPSFFLLGEGRNLSMSIFNHHQHQQCLRTGSWNLHLLEAS